MNISPELILSFFPNITWKRYKKIIPHLQTPEDVFSIQKKTLQTIWQEQTIHQFIEWRKSISIQDISRACTQNNIQSIAITDPNYPPLLKHIYDPPICLFIRGEYSIPKYPLAIVGTRAYSQYGKQITEQCIPDLVSHNITIISGLAFGIDSIAHRETISCGGTTIAVLGSGIDDRSIAPREHITLAHSIMKSGGSIISEYPPGTQATKYTFPKRNRIIAGMSLGTFLIEAKQKSGALITTQCALDGNREVFTIPHPITSLTSQGPHHLIQQGASLVTSAQDIIDQLDITLQSIEKINPQTSREEDNLLQYIPSTPTHIDDILRSHTIPRPEALTLLTALEMKGYIRSAPGMHYYRTI